MNAATYEAALAAAAQRIHLLERDDLRAMSSLLDSALVYVHSIGLVHGKTQLLDYMAQEIRVHSIKRELVFSSHENGLVFLVYQQSMHANPRNAPEISIKVRTHFSELWTAADGQWRLRHAQSTALSGKKSE